MPTEIHTQTDSSSPSSSPPANGKAVSSGKSALSSSTTSQLSGEALESFRNFEQRMYSEYQQMQKEYGFSVIEGDQSIDHVQAALRRAVIHLLLNIG